MNRLSMLSRFGPLVFAAMPVIAGAVPAAAAAPSCSLRVIAGNISEAVMAFQASRFCTGLPHSSDKAMSRVEELSACSQEAAALITDMMFGNDPKYRLIFQSDPQQIACREAAEIILD